MRVFPLFIDCRLRFTRNASAPPSLLLAPLGAGTVLGHLRSWLSTLTPCSPSVMAIFEPSADYEGKVGEACPDVESVFGQKGLAPRLGGYEASDWLFLVDPCYFPGATIENADLFEDPDRGPRWAKHVVALEPSMAGTKEYVESDPDGRVRRIQRYYHSVTWPFTKGITCSVLPMSCALLARDLPFSCLPELRRALSAKSIPSHDLPLSRAFDLTEERGLLALNESVVLDMVAALPEASGARGSFVAGSGCRVDPAARIMGPVVLEDGVEVQEGATIVGPSAIGAGSVVERDAVVAQCVVGRGSRVAGGTAVRHRVVFGRVTPERATSPTAAPPPPPLDARTAGSFKLSFEPRSRPPYLRLKRALDAVGALLVLAALSPLLLLCAVLIKLGSKGPVLYGDEREGRGGRPFRCWKLRTMVVGAHARQYRFRDRSQLDGPQFKIDADPRVTGLGALLRRASIDELPQLFNVVRGEMSLVGPRPSPFRENQMCIPWREARLSVRPGITGLWQVCRRKRSSGDFHQWIYYDLLYVKHQSAWVDLKILLATAVTLGGKWSVPLSWIVPPRKYYERRRSPREAGLADARSTA